MSKCKPFVGKKTKLSHRIIELLRIFVRTDGKRGSEVVEPARFCRQVARLREHVGDKSVVVRRVVVKKEELLHIPSDGKPHHVVHAAVAPTDVRGVFAPRVLGIADQHIGIFHEGREPVFPDLLPLRKGL